MNLDETVRRIAARAPSHKKDAVPRVRQESRQPRDETKAAPADTMASTTNLHLESNEAVAGPAAGAMPADVAILVALPDPELQSVFRAFPGPWQKEGRDGVVYNVTETMVGPTNLRLAVAVQNDMGMVPAAILATKTVRAWRPKLVAMVGICAGVRDKVNLGDIIVGKHIFDYGSGKLVQGRLMPDFQPVTVDDHLCNCAISLAADGDQMALIRAGWPMDVGKPPTDLTAHVGALASGAAVVADDSVIEGIQEHKRSLLGIDMEAYGMARATMSSISPPMPLVIKGVQDFADSAKNDQYRDYAAYVSTAYLRLFLESYWDQIAT